MNLLPQDEIKKIKSESRMRLIVVICYLLVFLEIISIIMLLPTYIVVKMEKETLSYGSEQIKKSVSGKGGVESEIKDVGSEIHAFVQAETLNKNTTTDTIKKVLALRPVGISSVSISVIKDGTKGVVQLAGVGTSREALIEYQRILSVQDFVKEAHYLENFIMQKSNINYNLVISLK